ncbi:leucyl aminopeptidase [Paroceanicella profunda]|uniref:Probable cytosol aminopeptidase n=1 Tax=Paroceanicella profunda TaxID=2579971 RepID=A0A5B8FHR7_9RHOB|nr:leucyl aminopeptidase [Paroceanicella profunda]QDL92507.1 leucyl aminopeptidase [Paroceanicella profunda]
MTDPVQISFEAVDISALAGVTGSIAVFVPAEGALVPPLRRLDRMVKGALKRAIDSKSFEKLEEGTGLVLAMPTGTDAEKLLIVKLGRNPAVHTARKAGAWVAKNMSETGASLVVPNVRIPQDIAYGLALRAYDFRVYKKAPEEEKPRPKVTIAVSDPEATAAASTAYMALVEGVFFTRDLVNEPSNVLTTTEFANRLAAMEAIGLEVEVLEEADLEKLGMRMLLGVGQGSASPTKMVVMKWMGGGDEPPFALVGKGVVFDTGGISIKPAGGMEEMTMDMGGAGVVSGVMRALALRRAKANVVGLVGLVENMPDGLAQRPGDIVKSMKGDTVEIINTDAEGRLVLGDVLWYAQERFSPVGMINLATLTGAIIVGLGHENAGVFSNDDTLAMAFLNAARSEGEGAWRMPMGPAYDKLIKSRLADMKNTGGRAGGSITAAQFLGRFVKDDTPWCHLDIAGVTLPPSETDLAPKGATGWGVRALDRLIRDKYEAE